VGWKVDWRRFRQFLKEEYGVTKAFTFIGYMPENEQLYEYMHSLGYLVVLKPTLEINSPPPKDDDQPVKPGARDPKDKSLIKGNVDTEVVLTAMKEINNYSKAIIVSADGDYYSLIEYLVSKNKLLHVLTPSWQYSTLLKEFERYIVNLDKYKLTLSYRQNKRKR
jgi:uncharacterized LabA/DUF88 family protein